MKFENFIRNVTISNEYVSGSNKQGKSKNHGQSKIKFKSSSNFFKNFEKVAKQNKRGDNETHDKYSYKGEICFYKKHVIQFINNIKEIYISNKKEYTNIDENHWKKYSDKFNEMYKDFNDNDLIIEELTTTNYRYHEQALVFKLYKEIIFHLAIPYACKLVFYKVINAPRLLVIPVVDFSLLETSYFTKLEQKLKEQDFKKLKTAVRKYQSWYRNKLLSRDEKCVLSKVEAQETLEGAHLKPYSVSNKKEQKDPMNGLLLTATFHKFLEVGLIGFDPETGVLLLSKFLSKNDKKWIEKNTKYFKNLKQILPEYFQNMKPYIEYHFKHIFIS